MNLNIWIPAGVEFVEKKSDNPWVWTASENEVCWTSRVLILEKYRL